MTFIKKKELLKKKTTQTSNKDFLDHCWVLLVTLTKLLPSQSDLHLHSDMTDGMPLGRFLMFLQKKNLWMFIKTQSCVCFPDNPAESAAAPLLRASHSAAVHLYATRFIYTLQTFIRANLMGVKTEGERVHKNSYKNAAAGKSGFCLNTKKSIMEIHMHGCQGVAAKVILINIHNSPWSHTHTHTHAVAGRGNTQSFDCANPVCFHMSQEYE